MKVFKSKYPKLGFYVNGEYKKFKNGEFRTDNKKDIDVLSKISGVTLDEEKKPVESKLANFVDETAKKPKSAKKVKK